MSFSNLSIAAAAAVAITIIIVIIMIMRSGVNNATPPLVCPEGTVLDYNSKCVPLGDRTCAVGETMLPSGECVAIGPLPPSPVGCVRGSNVTTWGTEYDSCDVESLALMKCLAGDKRWAYDAMWDSRLARGYNCGPSQFDYMGNTYDSICNTAITTGSISYDKLNCTKY